MGPSLERDAYNLGYQKGFSKKKNDAENAYILSFWSSDAFAGNQDDFRLNYEYGYQDGVVQRKAIEDKINSKLGETPLEGEKQIVDEYLVMLFNTFYGASKIFNSWEDRLSKELFPVLEDKINSQEEVKALVWNLIKQRNMQRALCYLKTLAIQEQNTFQYYQTLAVDKELHELRTLGKQGKIDRNQLEARYNTIHSELAKLASACIGNYKE